MSTTNLTSSPNSAETFEPQVEPDTIPLGVLLQQANLVSATEIAIALRDQKSCGLRLGEILACRGWLKQETADFFATQWERMVEEVQRGEGKYRLGDCLKQAGLLSETQIQEILRLQKEENLVFGEILVEKGYLKPETIALFVDNLSFYNSQSLERQGEDNVQSVKKLISLREYSLAIVELRNALKNNPHHPGLHALLAIVFIKTQQPKMARVHLEKAERMNAQDATVIEAKNLLSLHHHAWDVFNGSHQATAETTTHPEQEVSQEQNLLQKTGNGLRKLFLTPLGSPA